MKNLIDLVAYVLNEVEDTESSEDLAIYTKAMNCNNFGRCIIAMQEEMGSLHKNSM